MKEIKYMTLKITNNGKGIETEIVDAIPIEWFEKKRHNFYRAVETKVLGFDEEERLEQFFNELSGLIRTWKFQNKRTGDEKK